MNLEQALLKLKEGDEVVVAQSDLGEGSKKVRGIVGELESCRFYLWQDEVSGSYGDKKPSSRGKKYSWSVYRSDAEIHLINSKFSTMSLVKKFSDLFVQEPQKTFRNAGVTDNSDMLTEDGQKVFLSWLLSKNQDAFKTEVVDKIVETSDEKND